MIFFFLSFKKKVLLEEPAENADAPDPEDLGGHTGLTGTLALTYMIQKKKRKRKKN